MQRKMHLHSIKNSESFKFSKEIAHLTPRE